MKKVTLIFAAACFLFTHHAFAQFEKGTQYDPTPTPIIVYKGNNNYYANTQVKMFQVFLRELENSIVSADPSPQPSVFDINFDMVMPTVSYQQLLNLWYSGNNIEVRSECDLITESFMDRYGNIDQPVHVSQAAIDCGCSMIEKGHHVFSAQMAANRVASGASCPVQ